MDEATVDIIVIVIVLIGIGSTIGICMTIGLGICVFMSESDNNDIPPSTTIVDTVTLPKKIKTIIKVDIHNPIITINHIHPIIVEDIPSSLQLQYPTALPLH